jgi:ketosteroid isomerase-like protein
MTTWTAAEIAEPVRAALEASDLHALSALLSPDVQWGAPGDPAPACRNRGDVLAWSRRGRAAGTRAQVTEVDVVGDALLVGLMVDRGGSAGERWQVLTIGPDGVRDIRGHEDRASAVAGLPV